MPPATLVLECEQTEGGHTILLREPALGRRVDAVPMHDLGRVDLSRYRGLLLGLHCDQRHLAACRAQLAAFLDGGGTIAFCGHLAYPFIDGMERYRVIPGYRLDDLRVKRVSPHPVWQGVAEDDMTFRRGVAGFYGRGANPPPPDATVINTLGPSAAPVDWEWHPPSGGRVLVHAGADLWMYLETERTAARLAPQLLDWIEA